MLIIFVENVTAYKIFIVLEKNIENGGKREQNKLRNSLPTFGSIVIDLLQASV